MSSIIPIYYQIKLAIKNWIINKEYSPGDKIPSDNELANKFNVSRLTVRQAISQLIQEGYLIRRRGGGAFVNHEGKLPDLTIEYTGFMEDFFEEVSKSKIITVSIERILVPKLIREKLELKDKNEEMVFIKRIQFHENKPYAYNLNYLPIQIGTKITENDLSKKFILQIIEQDFGILLKEALRKIQASFADQEVSEKLGIPIGSPVLLVESIFYTQKMKPVYLVQTFYRGDLYNYIVRLKKLKRTNQNIWYISKHK